MRATLTVHGPRTLLRALRKRLAEGLREEAPATGITEHHGEQDGEHRLEFRLQSADGVPFPPLVAASAEYPDCVLTVTWEGGGASGQTTLRGGRAEEVAQGQNPGGPPCAIRTDAQGRLLLALALDIDAHGHLGFCATGGAETYFRLRGAAGNPLLHTIGGAALAWDEAWVPEADGYACNPVAPPQPVTPAERHALDHLAARLRADWLWYAHQPLEETIIERERYAEADRAVGAINVKSRQLARLQGAPADRGADSGAVGGADGGGLAYRTMGEEQAWIAALLAATWARAPGLTELQPRSPDS